MTKSTPAPDAVRLVPDEEQIFAWLSAKYVQRSDERQRAMNLQYMDAETHDLAASLHRWLAAAPAPATARGGDALKPLYGYWNYLKDPEGLARIRETLLDTPNWHEQAQINCNSLARLLDTIEALRPALASQPQATGGAVEREAIARIIASEFLRQDHEPNATPADVTFEHGLKWPYVDQGQIDFGEIADRVIAAIATQPAPSPGDVETLKTLLDNLVIAQSLSKEIRQSATDEARSYLYGLRHAAPSIQKGGEG